jgi:hypothetical protein
MKERHIVALFENFSFRTATVKKLFLLLWAVVFFALVSCKSTPSQPPSPSPSVETPAAPDGVSQDSLNALNEAVSRVEEARKRASDFESATYFPSDWENTETQYTAAGQLPRATEDEVREATARYTDLAGVYDALFKRVIPLYAQDREDEITAARDEALLTGLKDSFPDYLADADRTAVQALTQYEAEDYYTARDTAFLTRDKYRALKTGGEAYNKRQEILKRNFISRDPDNYNKAEETGLAAVEAYEAGNIEEALNNAEEAGLRYSLVLKSGWTSYASERKAAAGEERQKALDLKANVAVKAEFDAASVIYSQAEDSEKAENYADAADLYVQSADRFAVIAKTAAEKRQEAEEAIREAEQKILESEENVKKAELILEGGES